MQVYWYESMVMVLCYGVYIVVIIFNPHIERWSHKWQKKVRRVGENFV